MQRSFIPTTVEELRIGLEHARVHFAIPLHGDTLWQLFDKALERYGERKYTSRKESFSTSLVRVVRGAHSIPKHRFKAYLSALGAMGAHRRNHPHKQEKIIVSDLGPMRPDEIIDDQKLYGLGPQYLPL